MITFYEVRNPDDEKLRLSTLYLEEAKTYARRIFTEEGIEALITEIEYNPKDFRPGRD
jgi:hypothetical protein